MWTDFYEMVAKSAEQSRSTLGRELLDLFNDLNFDPPPDNLPDLHHPNPSVRRKNRERFAKLWRVTRQGLWAREWEDIHPGSVAELYVNNGHSSRIRKLWIDPLWQRGSLRIRLNLRKQGGLLYRTRDSLIASDFSYHSLVKARVASLRREKRKEPVVETRIRLRDLLGNAKGLAISQKLADFVLAVLDHAERVRI